MNDELPYRVGDAGATIFGPKRKDGQLPAIIATNLRKDRSRMIVKAVNCHDELLTALKECSRLIADYQRRTGESWPAYEMAETAIKNAS